MMIAHLISQVEHRDIDRTAIYVVHAEVLTGLFGEDAAQLVALLAGGRDRASGSDRDFLDQVVSSAEQCMQNDSRPVE